MNPNAASRKDIRAQEKASARLAANDREVVSGLMSTITGRAWIHTKLEFCHIFADPFTNEALLEAYRKGERNVGLVLLADIMAYCPNQYVLMMEEANARSTAAEYARSANSDRGDSEPSSEPTLGSEPEPEPDPTGTDFGPAFVDYTPGARH
jgi:hypothetical protein